MTDPIFVLYIHHSGAYAGSFRSLFEIIRAFPEGAVKPHMITQAGQVAEILRSAGIPIITTTGIVQIDNTEYGFYRGRRWLLLIRELCYLPGTVVALLKAKRAWPEIALVHVNEITALPAAALAKWVLKKPVVMHVRSVQGADAMSWRSRVVAWALRRFCDRIITIDEAVRRRLPPGLDCRIIHNGFTVPTASGKPDAGPLAALPRRHAVRVAMVGNLLPVKGVREFVLAAALCARRELDVDFVLVGANVERLRGFRGWLSTALGFAHDVKSDLELLIRDNALTNRVHLVGFTPDIHAVYRNVEILCFPSHLNAVGRPVLEAALYGVPSIVALNDPAPDMIRDRETGLCIEPRNAEALANAVEYFVSQPAEIRRMGENARRFALDHFDIRDTAGLTLDIYRELR